MAGDQIECDRSNTLPLLEKAFPILVTNYFWRSSPPVVNW